ncbi:MAG: hypothetical protein E6462_08440, partial [Staphylococcus epidermidis]|nr:hypothetical protein [Staphylococcus epidermidis]
VRYFLIENYLTAFLYLYNTKYCMTYFVNKGYTMTQFIILIETLILISINDITETIIDPELNEIEHHCDTIHYIIVKCC